MMLAGPGGVKAPSIYLNPARGAEVPDFHQVDCRRSDGCRGTPAIEFLTLTGTPVPVLRYVGYTGCVIFSSTRSSATSRRSKVNTRSTRAAR